MKTQIAEQFDQLHLSHSQIYCWTQCSLKYFFNYVERRNQEQISVALPFGTAIHLAAQRFYEQLMTSGKVEDAATLCEVFEEAFNFNIENSQAPILYNKTTPDIDSCIVMGKDMIEVFCKDNPVVGSDLEIVGVELPLTADLVNENGECQDLKLVGVIDLLLKKPDGKLVAIDLKTSATAYAKDNVDADMQLSVYSYLLTMNKMAFPKGVTDSEFHVLRKLKKPKLEIYKTQRGPADRKRFAKIASLVAKAIEQRLYIPNRSFLCGSCSYAKACQKW